MIIYRDSYGHLNPHKTPYVARLIRTVDFRLWNEDAFDEYLDVIPGKGKPPEAGYDPSATGSDDIHTA